MRFALTLLVVSGLAHWLFARWVVRAFPRVRARRIRAFAAVLTLLPIALRGLTHYTWSPWVTGALGVSMVEQLAVVAGSFVLFALHVLRAIATRVLRKRSASPDPKTRDAANEPEPATKPEPVTTPDPAPSLSRRELVERAAGLATYGAMGSLLGWGTVRGRHAFEATELVVKIPGLSRALDGYVIAQVSDVHTGAFVTERELREGFDLVRQMKPDLVVATGDLVDFEAGWAPLFARLFSDLPARDGRFAILGNHDYYADPERVAEALSAAKIDLLVNRGRLIRAADGGGFALLGVDDLWARKLGGAGPDLDRALRDVPSDAPRILLAHQPKYIEESAGRVALQLSGHTHGGQINPGFSPAALVMKYVVGRYEVGGTSLYVNRGFGVAGPPSRIGAPPEVTKVVLVAA